MRHLVSNRRQFLLNTGLSTGLITAAMVAGLPNLLRTAHADAKLAPTQSMLGGSNNYIPNAPFVENLGQGFVVHGTVHQAGNGEPLADVRIQIWAATTLGGEREPNNRGSVMSAQDGSFELEMMQIVPNFGEPHAHLAYDDDDFETVFLRPVMPNTADTSIQAHFVLARA